MKKNILRLSIALTIASASSNIRAETPSAFRYEFSLGIEAIRYFYKEPDIFQNELVPEYGAQWMNNTGNLYGLNGSYRLTWKETLFIQPEGRFLWGKHAYRTGRKEEVTQKTKKEIVALIYEPRLVAGIKIPVMHRLILSPYTGIGYRFKSDDSEETKTDDNDILGYYRKSNYVYIPLGGYVDYALNDTWSVSLSKENMIGLSRRGIITEVHMEIPLHPSYSNNPTATDSKENYQSHIFITKLNSRSVLILITGMSETLKDRQVEHENPTMSLLNQGCVLG
ncbi:hypothetical protein Cva_01032 [Caedimonas varicaedens]|uniref:Outer membrane protein beta-barrel domain-containing protein n=1 Tax=Caedimonas varicaedens TaxID=1629334 RepID=A0A0K8MDT5_9PROT|nr:hypothetical protein Cva_01032 [Caedimonas varicaedens]